MQSLALVRATIAPRQSPLAGPSGDQAPVEPLLDLAMDNTNTQGAYVYRLDRKRGAASLIGWTGLRPGPADAIQCQVMGEAAARLFERGSPIVVHEDAWSDVRFQDLPEFRTNAFEGVFSVPLPDADEVVGIANFCRSRRVPVQPRELCFFLGLGRPLGALLSGSIVRQDLERTKQKLEDRVLIERSKGLLQSDFGWTEEHAYLHLRRLSRQRRTPMREIAREMIDGRTSFAPRGVLAPPLNSNGSAASAGA